MKKVMKWAGFAALALLLIPVFSSTTYAQNSKAILDKVSAQFIKTNKVRANISFNMVNRAGKEMTKETGTFYMNGSSYKIEMKNQHIITNGKTIWTHLVSNKEVQIANYVEAEQSISPKQLFSGSYDKEFTHSYVKSMTFLGNNVHVINLKPKKRQSFESLDLYVNKSNNQIVGGKMHLKNGGVVNYTITNLNFNPSFTAQFFNFKPGAGVEVIDLR